MVRISKSTYGVDRKLHTNTQGPKDFRDSAMWRLDDYVAVCRGRKCTDERDMAYAGLSLPDKTCATDAVADANVAGPYRDRMVRLRADYTKRYSQVYQECA